MMKKMIFLMLVLLACTVSAADVCVVVDYGKESDLEPDSKCVDVDAGISGYELMQETGWSSEWQNNAYLCSVNDVGYEGGNCFGDKGWMYFIALDGEWFFPSVVLAGAGECWNRNKNSAVGDYCTKSGDTLVFLYGKWGDEPDMFKINVSRVEVDGKKQTKITSNGGKIQNALPGSKIKFRIELENLYDSSTDITIKDISIEGTIEEIEDGGNIEEDISEFDLDADRKVTQDLEFEIPLEVEDKDRLLKIEYTARDDAGIRYDGEFTYDLEVQKEGDEVRILEAALDKEGYTCGENGLLSISLLNTGKNNENVVLELVNEELGINAEYRFKLSNDVYEAASSYKNQLNVPIPSDANVGAYPLKVIANYGSTKAIEDVELRIKTCEGTSKQDVEVTNAPIKVEQIQGGSATVQNDQENLQVVGFKPSILESLLIGILGAFVIMIVVLLFFIITRK
jgi:hypothetical protein